VTWHSFKILEVHLNFKIYKPKPKYTIAKEIRKIEKRENPFLPFPPASPPSAGHPSRDLARLPWPSAPLPACPGPRASPCPAARAAHRSLAATPSPSRRRAYAVAALAQSCSSAVAALAHTPGRLASTSPTRSSAEWSPTASWSCMEDGTDATFSPTTQGNPMLVLMLGHS
jgi:hypothetical protein